MYVMIMDEVEHSRPDGALNRLQDKKTDELKSILLNLRSKCLVISNGLKSEMADKMKSFRQEICRLRE